MNNVYPIIFTQTDGAVLIEVPDFNILTAGKNIADAIEMARDAIGIAGIALEDKKKDIPKATDIRQLDVDNGIFSKDGKSYVSLVYIDFVEYRKKLGVQN